MMEKQHVQTSCEINGACFMDVIVVGMIILLDITIDIMSKMIVKN